MPAPLETPSSETEVIAASGVGEGRFHKLARLLDAVQVLNTVADLDAGLGELADRLLPIVAHDVFAVLLLDDAGEMLRFRYARGLADDIVRGWRYGRGQGLVGEAVVSGRLLVSEDSSRDPRRQPLCADLRSEVAIPMISRNRTVGVLAVGAKSSGSFAEGDVELLRLVADHLANAFENARLYENLRRQAQTLAILHEASRELTSILDRQTLLRRIAQLVRRLIDYHFFNVMLWSEARQELESIFEVGTDGYVDRPFSLPLGMGICGTAAALRQPLRVPNVEADPRYTTCSGVAARSELAVPLLIKDRLIGVLNLESKEYDAFSVQHEQLLSTLASYVAIALENARLYDRLRRDEKLLAEDLETARGIQGYLLPRKTPWIPGLQIAYAFEPARHLGGDFYDVLHDGNGRTAIFVGDVAGKGTAAALYGSLVLGMLRGSVADHRCSPERLLGHLNDELRLLSIERRFVALACATYDSRDRSLSLVNAGLPYPYLVRAGKVSELQASGLPIASMDATRYRSLRLELQSGDVVVLASDGLEECLDADGEHFGGDRLRQNLGALCQGSVRQIADGLIDATDRFLCGACEPSDDRTVVVLKVVENAGDSP